MPFALVIIGIILIVTSAKGTLAAFGSTLGKDLTGQNNFLYWIAAIGSVGALGYINELRTFSRYFMALIIIAFVLKNGGFFAQFMDAIKNGPIVPSKTPSGASAGTDTSGFTSGSASSGSGSAVLTPTGTGTVTGTPSTSNDLIVPVGDLIKK